MNDDTIMNHSHVMYIIAVVAYSEQRQRLVVKVAFTANQYEVLVISIAALPHDLSQNNSGLVF